VTLTALIQIGTDAAAGASTHAASATAPAPVARSGFRANLQAMFASLAQPVPSESGDVSAQIPQKASEEKESPAHGTTHESSGKLFAATLAGRSGSKQGSTDGNPIQPQQAVAAQAMPVMVPADLQARQSISVDSGDGGTSQGSALSASVSSLEDAAASERERGWGRAATPAAPPSLLNGDAPIQQASQSTPASSGPVSSIASGNGKPAAPPAREFSSAASDRVSPATPQAGFRADHPAVANQNKITSATTGQRVIAADSGEPAASAETPAGDASGQAVSGQARPKQLNPEISGTGAVPQPKALPQNAKAAIASASTMTSTNPEPGNRKSAHNAQADVVPAAPLQSAEAFSTRSQGPAAEKSTASAAQHAGGDSAPASSHASTAASNVIPSIAPSAAAHAVPVESQDRSGAAVRTSTAPASSNTFSALDAGTPPATWLHAGTRHAEAGYLDPALGWVGVRAEITGGTLHAAIVPGSAQAAQTLSGHLSGLNIFLAEHHGESAYVTMAAPDRGLGSNAHQQQQQDSAQQNQQTGSSSGRPIHPASQSGSTSRWEPAAGVPTGGGHISVMA
jgi:hypothetical protein